MSRFLSGPVAAAVVAVAVVAAVIVAVAAVVVIVAVVVVVVAADADLKQPLMAAKARKCRVFVDLRSPQLSAIRTFCPVSTKS